MDMSFANQALGCEYIAKNYKKLEKKHSAQRRSLGL